MLRGAMAYQVDALIKSAIVSWPYSFVDKGYLEGSIYTSETWYPLKVLDFCIVPAGNNPTPTCGAQLLMTLTDPYHLKPEHEQLFHIYLVNFPWLQSRTNCVVDYRGCFETGKRGGVQWYKLGAKLREWLHWRDFNQISPNILLLLSLCPSHLLQDPLYSVAKIFIPGYVASTASYWWRIYLK